MSKTQYAIIVLIMLIGRFAWSATDSTSVKLWTVEACVNAALQASHRIEISELNELNAYAQIREERSARFGSLDISAVHNRNSEVQELQIALPGMTRTIRFGDGTMTDYAAGWKIPIYTGGALSARIAAAEAAWSAIRSDRESDLRTVTFETRKLYYTLQTTNTMVEIASTHLERIQRKLEEAKSMQTIGMSSQEQVSLVASALESASVEYEKAKQERELLALQMGWLIGRTGEKIYATPEARIHDESASHLAAKRRPELRAMDYRIDQSKRMTRAALGTWLPSVSGNIAAHYAKPGIDAVKNEWMRYANGGVSLNWTLWDGAARNQRIERARLQERVLKVKRSELEQSITLSCARAVSRIEHARNIDEHLRKKLENDRIKLQMVEQRLSQGNATRKEWLDAQDDVTLSEMNVANSALQIKLNTIEYSYARGN